MPGVVPVLPVCQGVGCQTQLSPRVGTVLLCLESAASCVWDTLYLALLSNGDTDPGNTVLLQWGAIIMGQCNYEQRLSYPISSNVSVLIPQILPGPAAVLA